MSNTQRIILVSELFYPEESATAHILSKIARTLARDYDVLVLTGPASYEGRANLNALDPPIPDKSILRLSLPPLNKNNLLHRLFRFMI